VRPRHDAVPRRLPPLDAAQQGLHVLHTELREIERRTGAGVLVRSSTVGDDRLLRRLEFGRLLREVLVQHENRAGDVSFGVRLRVAYIQDDDVAGVEGLLEVGDRDADSRELSERLPSGQRRCRLRDDQRREYECPGLHA